MNQYSMSVEVIVKIKDEVGDHAVKKLGKIVQHSSINFVQGDMKPKSHRIRAWST